MIDLIAIEPRQGEDGFLSFVAVLRVEGNRTVEVPAEIVALQHYDLFQRIVLERTGQFFRLAGAEGRLPLDADNYWRLTVACILDKHWSTVAAKGAALSN